MSQGNSRKKRRPRFSKPDTVNVILGSLAVILVLAWGGLYWDKTTDRSFVVNAKGAPPVIIAELDGTIIPSEAPPTKKPAAVVKPGKTEQAGKPNEPVAELPDSSEAPEETPVTESVDTEKPVATPRPVKTPKPAKPTSTEKPDKGTVTKPGTVSTPKPEEEPAVVTEPPVNPVVKYEQQLAQLQAKCTQDMGGILAGAEESVAQLDMSDPYAFQELNQKWMDGLSNAEADCNAKFQGMIASAEKDGVEQGDIEEWEQAYSSLMLQLQSEFEAKLLLLMGG
ncbi:outer membrane biosynthesis protein TonB [Paenibacillus endophyticus]|uniref:Outer membrane biosynthesis protein TonB n=1 Tax=Paenibacillus endophyticus TaxID=1294268 RepID=A0A7W5CDJ7_9BACL|nr:hypothetical protein [Paenibacillus endophyticus]MBB3155204.1 outer membrane biosynthesis protein TonB [Paenibacillus endophyticus]